MSTTENIFGSQEAADKFCDGIQGQLVLRLLVEDDYETVTTPEKDHFVNFRAVAGFATATTLREHPNPTIVPYPMLPIAPVVTVRARLPASQIAVPTDVDRFSTNSSWETDLLIIGPVLPDEQDLQARVQNLTWETEETTTKGLTIARRTAPLFDELESLAGIHGRSAYILTAGRMAVHALHK